MLRVVKLSIRFVLYRSADDNDDDDGDDDALKLSFSRCFAPTFPTVSRATWEKLSNSRERTNVWQCHKWGRQWAMHSGARALKLEQCAPSFSLRDRFDAVLPSLSLFLSLSRKSCAGICVSQARFEFCMNCISSLKNENKASNYLKFDNLLALRYLCFNRLSSVPEMTSLLPEWCQLFIYIKKLPSSSLSPFAKGKRTNAYYESVIWSRGLLYKYRYRYTHIRIQLQLQGVGCNSILDTWARLRVSLITLNVSSSLTHTRTHTYNG